MPLTPEQAAFWESRGSELTAPAGRPLLLDDPRCILLLASGGGDLLVASLSNGKPAGNTRFLGRAEQGQALAGLPHALEQGSAGIVLVPDAATRLLSLSWRDLQELARRPDGEDPVLWLLDSVIGALWAALVADTEPPAGMDPLPSEGETSLAQGGGARCADGVIWVETLEGVLRPLADEGLEPLLPGASLPMASGAWVRAGDDSRLRCLGTRQWLARDPSWQGLSGLLETASARLRGQFFKDNQGRKARLEDQSRRDEALLDKAYSQLSSVLGGKRSFAAKDMDMEDSLLAACRMVGERLGLDFKQPPPVKAGAVLADPLEELARISGIKMRRVALKRRWWTQDAGPMLGFVGPQLRPVALLPVSSGSYQMVEPGDGAARPITAETAQSLDPFAVTFYRPFPQRVLSGRDVWRFGAQGLAGDMRLLFWMAALVGLLGLLTPLATGIIYSDIIPYAARGYMLQLTVILLVGYLASAAFTFVRNLATLRIEGKMDYAVQSALWDRLMALPASFFRGYSTGDLALRALGINAIRRLISGTVATTVMGSLFSVVNLILMFYYSWKLSLLGVALMLLAMAYTTLASLRQLTYQRESITLQGKISSLVQQLIVGLGKLRLAGAENRAFAIWAEQFTRQKTLAMKSGGIANRLAAFNAAVPVLSSGVLFAWIVFLEDRGAIASGDFLAFNSAFTIMLTSAIQVSAALVSTLNVVPYFERLKPIVETIPEVDETKGRPGQLQGRVELNHVSFRYAPEGPPILDDVSLTLRPGEFVALVGPSGSGKSTLLRLLLGFDQPEQGTVYYDQFDLAAVDVTEVRRQIGVVLQNATVMTGDIFSNIVGSAPLGQDAAWEAAAMAGLDEDIRNMPMGMHTVVSEGGSTLSGGQRQRLLIARALVRKPRIIIFDEATSALDNRTQALVSRSLEGLKATRLVIAHRLSTIVNADRILVLERGRIREEGTYSQLMAGGGIFAELAKRQLA